ncbi:MAG: hypothetical protein Q8M11_17080 [Sulfuritalea sp.]|nr:hypothetical protein [Sulfuritalea sp.]MDP1984701.1 hypothetical protein [Sulfuritalea sp.]
MNKPEELDLRTVIPQREPLRCSVSEHEIYEVRFEVLVRGGSDGSASRMDVLRSTDGGKTWRPVRLRRDWPRQWWPIIKDGLGGGWWPPSGSDVRDAYVKDDKFTISYCNFHEHGPKGQAYAWEMQYDANADRWDLVLLEEIAILGDTH